MQTQTLLPNPVRELPLAESESGYTQLPLFMPGDVINFACQDDLYGKVSRWLMRTSGEGPTYSVHTAQFLDADRYLELDIVGKIRPTSDLLIQHHKRDL